MHQHAEDRPIEIHATGLAPKPHVVDAAPLPVEPPALPRSRERHEALAAIEREIASLYGARTRNLPTLIAKLRSLL